MKKDVENMKKYTYAVGLGKIPGPLQGVLKLSSGVKYNPPSGVLVEGIGNFARWHTALAIL